jgi:tRNA-2-methylthio-N6-dimethylallyladenosine synthase
MPEQVAQAVKEERNQRLLEVVNASGARQHQEFVGRQVEILVEGLSKRNPARLTGRTRCNKIVVFDGSAEHRGRLLEVKVQRAGTFTLYAAVDEGR